MKKAKKLAMGLLFGSILGTSLIVPSIASNNTSLSNNEIDNNAQSTYAANTIDYDKHIVNGVQLEDSTDSFTYAGDFWKIWTNMDLTEGKFVAGIPAYVMIIINKSVNPGYDYLNPPPPPFQILDNNPEAGRYLLTVKKPEVGVKIGKHDFNMSQGKDGPSVRCQFYYDVMRVELINIDVTGISSYNSGENFDLNAEVDFDYVINLPADLKFKWYTVIDGIETLIGGQSTSHLTSVVPKVPEGSSLQIKCSTVWNDKIEESGLLDISVTNTPEPPTDNKPGDNNQGDNANSNNNEESNILTEWYLWLAIGLGVLVIAVIVIIIFMVKNRQKLDVQSRQIKNISSRKLTTAGPAVKQLSGPTGPGPQRGPNGPAGPRPNGPGPVPPRGPAPRAGAPGAQRPGAPRPNGPMPPKIEVNAPPRSLAPKRK